MTLAKSKKYFDANIQQPPLLVLDEQLWAVYHLLIFPLY
ncbi:hypothetical protein T08_14304 [Trichinella sp. T8]|nr:hypothetical protein T08_14304 [Trichinella sp. T8]